jgi:hypothetical protein
MILRMRGRVSRRAAAALYVCSCLLSQNRGVSQERERSASELIKRLTHQTDRPSGLGVSFGTCGSFGYVAAQDRSTVQSLVKLGASALPDIEVAFDSIENRGPASPFSYNAHWLLYAYAKIKGPEAFLRLREMRSDSQFMAYGSALDDSAALSLALTSYVSIWRRGIDVSCRSPQPRDALDQMILAWERGDQALLERTLGPHARAALSSLLEDRTWDALRTQLWTAKPSDRIAVGYRFDVQGPWSQPLETLEDRKPIDDVQEVEEPELDTLFKDGSGKDCGRTRILFLSPGFDSPNSSYLVDNADIGALLGLISRCAANE